MAKGVKGTSDRLSKIELAKVWSKNNPDEHRVRFWRMVQVRLLMASRQITLGDLVEELGLSKQRLSVILTQEYYATDDALNRVDDAIHAISHRRGWKPRPLPIGHLRAAELMGD